MIPNVKHLAASTFWESNLMVAVFVNYYYPACYCSYSKMHTAKLLHSQTTTPNIFIKCSNRIATPCQFLMQLWRNYWKIKTYFLCEERRCIRNHRTTRTDICQNVLSWGGVSLHGIKEGEEVWDKFTSHKSNGERLRWKKWGVEEGVTIPEHAITRWPQELHAHNNNNYYYSNAKTL